GNYKLLSEKEIVEWRERLQKYAEDRKNDEGAKQISVFFMWNTNWEDHSIVNAFNFRKCLESNPSSSLVLYPWKESIKEDLMKKGIASFFVKKDNSKDPFIKLETQQTSDIKVKQEKDLEDIPDEDVQKDEEKN